MGERSVPAKSSKDKGADPASWKPRFHGRRQGHRLRPRQKALVETLLPKLRVPIPETGVLDLASLFPTGLSAFWLEIGFGAAEHLVWQAERNPHVGIIGCEPFRNGVAKLLVAVSERGLTNVRIHDDDARDLLPHLPSESFSRIFLLFPDPWPKKRHRKRRFVSPETVATFHRLLIPGGEFRFASDIPDYVDWTLCHVHRHGGFHWPAEAPEDWRDRPADWPQTRYEAKAIAAGRRPAYLTFIRK